MIVLVSLNPICMIYIKCRQGGVLSGERVCSQLYYSQLLASSEPLINVLLKFVENTILLLHTKPYISL